MCMFGLAIVLSRLAIWALRSVLFFKRPLSFVVISCKVGGPVCLFASFSPMFVFFWAGVGMGLWGLSSDFNVIG